ncbi:hypothetical protein DSM112329_02800 [Paraconexibacter sp. AEG42_29]|uniref:Uncharacterized protein n=1 Tax=Paraconexibacter sp. AEG42_29 TaxID=2997339 RepID=A0AAU7AWF3_9ACTN
MPLPAGRGQRVPRKRATAGGIRADAHDVQIAAPDGRSTIWITRTIPYVAPAGYERRRRTDSLGPFKSTTSMLVLSVSLTSNST